MAVYSVWMLEAGNISVSGGKSLSGITQGDGSHLLGETITLQNLNVIETFINDDDPNFDDNDTGQRLAGAQTIDGQPYPGGTRVEAEYRIVLEDPNGNRFTAIGYNVNNSSPAFATVEGLAFLGPRNGWPPAGVPLRVVQTTEGPGSSGIPPAPYDQFVVPCFTPGTRIRCPGGPRRIETLRPGDLVCVKGAPPQPLRLLARTEVDAATAAARPWLAPVTIAAGALGPGRPVRDLTVSPQHRILMRGARCELHLGLPEALVAAVHLIDGATVRQAPPGPVTYLHLLFDAHRIVWAEGVETESLWPGLAADPAAPPALKAELAALFGAAAPAPTARPVARRREALILRG